MAEQMQQLKLQMDALQKQMEESAQGGQGTQPSGP